MTAMHDSGLEIDVKTSESQWCHGTSTSKKDHRIARGDVFSLTRFVFSNLQNNKFLKL